MHHKFRDKTLAQPKSLNCAFFVNFHRQTTTDGIENEFPGLLFLRYRISPVPADRFEINCASIANILSSIEKWVKIEIPISPEINSEIVFHSKHFAPNSGELRIISNIYLNHHILSGRPRIQSPWEPPITSVGTEFVCDNRKMSVVLTNYRRVCFVGIGIYSPDSIIFRRKAIFLRKKRSSSAKNPSVRDDNLWPMFCCHSQRKAFIYHN